MKIFFYSLSQFSIKSLLMEPEDN